MVGALVLGAESGLVAEAAEGVSFGGGITSAGSPSSAGSSDEAAQQHNTTQSKPTLCLPRLGKARNTFSCLQTIWKSKQYSLKTKIQLYNSNVKSVLLYGSECWRVIESDMNKLSSFHNGCLRKICRIFWPEKISNKDLYRKTNCRNVVLEIKHRRLRWLGHVLRMDQNSIPKVALRWTPPGKRKQGRPKTTWRRTVTSELKMANLTWGEAQHAAQDRIRWKQIVTALCSTGNEED